MQWSLPHTHVRAFSRALSLARCLSYSRARARALSLSLFYSTRFSLVRPLAFFHILFLFLFLFLILILISLFVIRFCSFGETCSGANSKRENMQECSADCGECDASSTLAGFVYVCMCVCVYVCMCVCVCVSVGVCVCLCCV